MKRELGLLFTGIKNSNTLGLWYFMRVFGTTLDAFIKKSPILKSSFLTNVGSSFLFKQFLNKSTVVSL